MTVCASPYVPDTGGGTRTRTALRPTDFLTTTAFAARHKTTVRGLDYTFTFYYARGVTVRRGPSSLYTFLPDSRQA